MATNAPTNPGNAWGLPTDFVFAMAETTYGTLQEWLEAAGVPAEIVELLRVDNALRYSLCHMPGGLDPLEMVKGDLTGLVAAAANAIAAVGGGFNGSDSTAVTHVEEHAKAWAAARKCKRH